MSNEMIELLIKSFWETGYMVVASTVLASLIGIPLGMAYSAECRYQLRAGRYR